MPVIQRLLVACLFLFSTMPLAAQQAGGAVATPEPILVGAVFNLSGDMASLDGPGFQGMKLAAARVNADGGVLGRPLRIAYLNGESDPQAITRGMPHLIERGVAAIVGLNDSDSALAAGAVAQAAGMPFVTAGATLPDLPERTGDYVFLAAFGDDAQAHTMADFALDDLHARTAWVLVSEDHVFTRALAGYFVERLSARGGAVQRTDVYAHDDTDIASQIAALKNLPSMPDVLFVSAMPAEAGMVTKQLREAGIVAPILSGDGFDTPLLVETAGDLARDVYFATHVSLDNPDPTVQDFVGAYTATYGHAPENAFAALGYDAMMLVADAIRRAGSTDATALREALAATQDLDAVTGDIGYERGSRVPRKDVTVMRVQDGRMGFVKTISP